MAPVAQAPAYTRDVTRTPPRLLSRAAGAAVCAALAVAAGLGRGARASDPPAPPASPAPAAPDGSRGPAPGPAAAPTRAAEARWLDESGTALLGFGILRVAPTAPGVPGTVRLRYEEQPSDYATFDAVQLLVLPADAFGKDGRGFADRALAWGRSPRGAYAASVEVRVAAPAVWLVGFGPFTGVDTSRPLGTARAYALEVADDGRVARAWVDPQAGELTVKAWTARPEVERGGPVTDPLTGTPRWFEVRPELVYDGARLAAPDDPEPPQHAAARREADSLRARARELRAAGKADAAADLEREADDVLATLATLDDRVPVPGPLAARLRRLPFRWR